MDVLKDLKVKDLSVDYQIVLSSVYYTHFWLLDKYKDILKEYNITPQQANVLGTVNYFAPQALTLSELKKYLLEKNADVSRVVSRLTQKKLLNRVVNAQNRRMVEITLTKKGKDLINLFDEKKHFVKFTSGFTSQEAQQLVDLLQKLRKE